eukprot:c39904_g1_i1.p1 GENE.c39904_g1_i1~~c39904_g1_i1.p1  ORF type:complete len:193 (+),score=50.06 c39904_g1_i1:116-694(+)
MKFTFCGGLDAPDWILAEIGVISKLTVMQLRRLVSQVIKAIMGEEIETEVLGKVAQDAGFSSSDLKAAFATVDFIARSGARYGCGEETLSAELQQLGLPTELVSTLTKLYGKDLAGMQAALQAATLQLERVDKIDWRVDYLVSSSNMRTLLVPSVSLRIGTDAGEAVYFEMTAQKLAVLLQELKVARSLMDR